MVPLKTIMVIIAELLSLESYIHVTPVTSRKKKNKENLSICLLTIMFMEILDIKKIYFFNLLKQFLLAKASEFYLSSYVCKKFFSEKNTVGKL